MKLAFKNCHCGDTLEQTAIKWPEYKLKDKCNRFCLFGHLGFSFDKLPLSHSGKVILGFSPADNGFFENVLTAYQGVVKNDVKIFQSQCRLMWQPRPGRFARAQAPARLTNFGVYRLETTVNLENNAKGQLIKKLAGEFAGGEPLSPAQRAQITPEYIFPASRGSGGGGGGGAVCPLTTSPENCITYAVNYLHPTVTTAGAPMDAFNGHMSDFFKGYVNMATHQKIC